jgi:membrane peptidoglycan carboxypeptidase
LRTAPETPPGANYFLDVAANETRRLSNQEPSDLTVQTTLDVELQRIAEAVVQRRLETTGRRRNLSQAALIAIRPDGAVAAMVGGVDYETSQFNRATQARRPAGSLFKLFVYLAALERGYTPQTMLADRPIQIGEWEPQNANGRFRGAVTLRTAFAQSINTVAVQLADEIGLPAIINTAAPRRATAICILTRLSRRERRPVPFP